MKKDQINVDSSLRIGLFLNWTTMLKTGVLKDDFSDPPEATMMSQTVPASTWPKAKAALCGYSFAPERAQNAPIPGSDTAGTTGSSPSLKNAIN